MGKTAIIVSKYKKQRTALVISKRENGTLFYDSDAFELCGHDDYPSDLLKDGGTQIWILNTIEYKTIPDNLEHYIDIIKDCQIKISDIYDNDEEAKEIVKAIENLSHDPEIDIKLNGRLLKSIPFISDSDKKIGELDIYIDDKGNLTDKKHYEKFGRAIFYRSPENKGSKIRLSIPELCRNICISEMKKNGLRSFNPETMNYLKIDIEINNILLAKKNNIKIY
mgnify:CR=1 FL=1